MEIFFCGIWRKRQQKSHSAFVCVPICIKMWVRECTYICVDRIDLSDFFSSVDPFDFLRYVLTYIFSVDRFDLFIISSVSIYLTSFNTFLQCGSVWSILIISSVCIDLTFFNYIFQHEFSNLFIYAHATVKYSALRFFVENQVTENKLPKTKLPKSYRKPSYQKSSFRKIYIVSKWPSVMALT
jgi:hypothetical protein